MKKINNSLTKRALFALALTSLSLTNAFALDINVPADGRANYVDITADSGTIHLGRDSFIYFIGSHLGNDSGGRFSFTFDYPSPGKYSIFGLDGSSGAYGEIGASLYTDGIFATDLHFDIVWRAFAFIDNNIELTGANSYVRIAETSTLIANHVKANSIYFEIECYGEFTAEAEYMNMVTSYWKSFGSSSVDRIRIESDSTIELVMTSEFDAIFTNEVRLDGSLDFNICFCDSFIDSIISGAGYFDIDLSNTITGSVTGPGTLNVNIADSNGEYTWTVTDLGNDIYRISDFVIPEPSTYAAIFGVIALAFVAYRRRKS